MTTSTQIPPVSTAPAAGRKGRKGVWTFIIAIVAFAGGGLLAAKMLSSRLPSPNDDLVEVAKFSATSRFKHRLTEEEKRPYMARLRENRDAIEAARAGGQLTEKEYEHATFNVWL